MAGRGKSIVVAAVALFLGVAARPVHAQIGGASAVDVVAGQNGQNVLTEDDPTEQNTAGILQQDSTIATSVTTGGGAGNYTPIGGYIGNLDTQLFSGINNQNFVSNFPGWQPLPVTSTLTAEALVKDTLTTYQASIALAQSQEQELEGENFSNIEAASSQTNNLLTAVQANTEAALQEIKELQYLRQLVSTLITVESTQAAERLNTAAQQEATSEVSPIPIVGP
jgi:hypothetical protein